MLTNAYAVNDRVRTQKYQNNQCTVEALKSSGVDTPGSTIGSTVVSTLLGDYSLEFDNLFCVGHVAGYLSCIGAIYAGKPTAALLICGGITAASVGTFAASVEVFKNTHICGDNWTTFMDDTGIIRGAYEGSYKLAVKNCITKGEDYCWIEKGMSSTPADLTNKTFREYIYNGIEYEDNTCSNSRTRENFQRYYMRGYEAGNFACERFIPRGEESSSEFKVALLKRDFECCVERSQNTICIEFGAEAGITGKFKNATTKIANIAIDISEATANWGINAGEDIANWGINAGEDISNTGINVSDVLVNWGIQSGNIIANWGINTGENITDWGLNTGENIALFGIDKTEYITQFSLYNNETIETTNQARTKVNNAITRALEAVDERTGQAGVNFNDILETARADIEEAMNTAKTQVENTMSKAKTDVENAMNKARSKVADYEASFTKHKFCNVNDYACWIKGVGFQAFKSTDTGHPNDICARTWSLCPYNHNIGGGSYLCDLYPENETTDGEGRANAKYGECRNFCQRLKHCTQVPSAAVIYEPNISSPYFDIACKNFMGSSQNRDNYNSMTSPDSPETFQEKFERKYEEFSEATTQEELDLSNYRGFTAPITQCMVETFRNVFFNRAGHSKCADGTIPDTGVCGNGEYIYRQGQDLMSSDIPQYAQRSSIFNNLQKGIKNAVLVAITLSLVFFGWKILISGGKIEAKDILLYLIKIGLVLYFATGTAWRDFFFDAAYGIMQTASNLGMKIDASLNSYTILDENEQEVPSNYLTNRNMDGCQFGPSYNPFYINYGNKTYLATWDTFDCKIARYLSYGPDASFPNVILLIFAGWFTGGLGVALVVASFVIAFFVIIMAIKALYFFVMCNLALILLIYISPIVITMTLFKKTADIFQTWLRFLISFTLQPLILFVYLTFFFIVLDSSLQGSVLFEGVAPKKVANCSDTCKKGNQIKLTCTEEDLKDGGWELARPKDDSAICILGLEELDTIPFLKPVGVLIYKLAEGVLNPQRIIVLFKFAFLMFILSKLLDVIPGMAATLTGGPELPLPKISLTSLLLGSYGFLKFFQKAANWRFGGGGRPAPSEIPSGALGEGAMRTGGITGTPPEGGMRTGGTTVTPPGGGITGKSHEGGMRTGGITGGTPPSGTTT